MVSVVSRLLPLLLSKYTQSLNGRQGIRTPGAFRLAGFQDRIHKPLGQPPRFMRNSTHKPQLLLTGC